MIVYKPCDTMIITMSVQMIVYKPCDTMIITMSVHVRKIT